MFKNVAQKLTVFAFADEGHASLDAGEPVTGDAANITCKIEQDDDGTQSASNDTNPTEVEDGQYRFDLLQAESNGDKLTFYPESSTAGVQVIALPSNVIYTRPANFADIVSKIDTIDGIVDAILVDTGTTLDGKLNTIDANVDTLLTRITSTLFSGITSLAEWLGLIAGKQSADDTARTELRATGAGSGTFDETTDSQEAIRDHVGDGTNLTEAGGTGDHLTAITGGGSDTLKTLDTAIAAVDGNIDTLIARVPDTISLANINTEADTALSDFWTSPATLVDLIWDEPLTGATHNVVNSAGRRLRTAQLSMVIREGTIQGATTNTVTLDSNASATDDIYNNTCLVVQGEEFIVTDYDGGTKVASLDHSFVGSTPSSGAEFELVPARATLGQITHSGATIPTVTAVSNAVTVGTNNDKTGYGLADNAITAGKYDESTAFPLKSADTGSTEVARTGADSDTLETLSDQIDGVSGGATNVTVAPIQTTVNAAEFTTFGATVRHLSMAQNASGTFTFTVTDGDGDAVSQAGDALTFIVHDSSGNAIFTVTSGAGEITVSGDDNSQVEVAISSAKSNQTPDTYLYKLWNTTDNDVLASGRFEIKRAPQS